MSVDGSSPAIVPLVGLLKEGGFAGGADSPAAAEGRRHAAASLWHLVSHTSNARVAVEKGGVPPLVMMLTWPQTARVAEPRAAPSPALIDGQEGAASVLAELCLADGDVGPSAQRALQESQGVFAVASLLEPGGGCTALARRHGACILGSLASGAAAMRPTSAKSRPATGVLTASNTYTTSKASHWASGR